MLQRKHNRWNLYPHKVRYTNEPTEIDVAKWALPNKEWWTEIANKHENITLHKFIDVEVTKEMQERYEEIKDMPEDFFDVYVEYVLTGDTSDEVELPTNHPFNIIRLRKEKEKLESRINLQDSTVEEILFNIIPNIGGQ